MLSNHGSCYKLNCSEIVCGNRDYWGFKFADKWMAVFWLDWFALVPLDSRWSQGVSSEGPDVPRVSASLGSRDVRILDWKEGRKEGLRECDVIGVDCCCTWSISGDGVWMFRVKLVTSVVCSWQLGSNCSLCWIFLAVLILIFWDAAKYKLTNYIACYKLNSSKDMSYLKIMPL